MLRRQVKCVTCNHYASMQTQPLLHQTMFSPHISCLPALYKVQTSLSSGTCFFKWHQIANGFFSQLELWCLHDTTVKVWVTLESGGCKQYKSV